MPTVVKTCFCWFFVYFYFDCLFTFFYYGKFENILVWWSYCSMTSVKRILLALWYTLNRSWATKSFVACWLWWEEFLKRWHDFWIFPDFRGMLTIECVAHSVRSQTWLKSFAATTGIWDFFQPQVFSECTINDWFIIKTKSFDKIFISCISKCWVCRFGPYG